MYLEVHASQIELLRLVDEDQEVSSPFILDDPVKHVSPLFPKEILTKEIFPVLKIFPFHLRIIVVVKDMLLEIQLRFAILLADLARIASVFFDPEVLSIFGSAFFQMLLGFPCRLKSLIALRALFVIGCKLQRIFSALLSQHILKFLGCVSLIRLF